MTILKKILLTIAISGLMTANALTVAYAGCTYTDWFSEEDDETHEPRADCDVNNGYAVRGIRCEGGNCDNKQLYCCTDGLPTLDLTTRDESPFFSEEDDEYVYEGRVVTGMECQEDECDNISLTTYGFCDVPPVTGDPWSEGPFSEEDNGDNKNEGRCDKEGKNGFVIGLKCEGSNCDNLTLTCVAYKNPNTEPCQLGKENKASSKKSSVAKEPPPPVTEKSSVTKADFSKCVSNCVNVIINLPK